MHVIINNAFNKLSNSCIFKAKINFKDFKPAALLLHVFPFFTKESHCSVFLGAIKVGIVSVLRDIFRVFQVVHSKRSEYS